ncbi:hypothetical protein GC194_05205 [bacterium]|nr:hypothetical protein [bacterium]
MLPILLVFSPVLILGFLIFAAIDNISTRFRNNKQPAIEPVFSTEWNGYKLELINRALPQSAVIDPEIELFQCNSSPEIETLKDYWVTDIFHTPQTLFIITINHSFTEQGLLVIHNHQLTHTPLGGTAWYFDEPAGNHQFCVLKNEDDKTSEIYTLRVNG